MERLTYKSIIGGWTYCVPRQKAIDRLAEYEDIGLEPEEIKKFLRRWCYTAEHGGFSQPPNAPLPLEELRKMDRNHVIAYLPGEKVYDRFGTPWIIESSEIHLIRGELKQLFRCGHPGTEDYHAMYEDEIYTSPFRRKPEEGEL